ncbi:SMP-30/gluconolactonase/LRE family protein [Aquimarina sp. RZ0]|uniref:SMP-30/gluconolactonase/LRE family protein n=1 Tax=Aquimarina sp. RZ0 TaxID=2607730 RepID=UPI0011F2A145|nr:SMP-30/gluconolactonase/LRE family protein [Aquimarina sp. RZ0]KAA1242985.1 T9SS type A sorting domain-containing protein [Aquimarina sp. RZ0]
MRKLRLFYLFIAFSSVITTVEAQITNESTGQNYEFLEGPVWDGSEFIYFTDIPNNTIVKYSITQKTFAPITTSSNRGNGLMFNRDMNLVVCEGTTSRITERNTNGDVINTITSEYQGIRFNSPNDLCIDAKGGIYFTDPNFGTPEYQPKNRVYYLNPAGTVIELVDDMEKPNGVLLSNDGEVLYISNTFSDKVRAYDVSGDGTLTNQRDFGTLQVAAGGVSNTGADGMATDVDGNLYVTSEAGVQVFDKNGNRTQVIAFPEKTTNCTFGGVNKDILFVTAGKNLYSMPSPVQGFQHPFDLPTPNLSVNDFSDSETIFFPNPIINNTVVIKNTGEDLSNATFRLFDLKGKKVSDLDFHIEKKSGIIKFDDSLSRGTYLLKIENEKHQVISKKIILK